jgi:hypothetical protein
MCPLLAIAATGADRMRAGNRFASSANIIGMVGQPSVEKSSKVLTGCRERAIKKGAVVKVQT